MKYKLYVIYITMILRFGEKLATFLAGHTYLKKQGS